MATSNSTFKESVKIPVYPHGYAMGGPEDFSFVLFKDKEGQTTFPIWYPDLPMNMVLDQQYSFKGPYEFTFELLEALGYQVIECFFQKAEDMNQQAELLLSKDGEETTVEVLAYQGLSMGIQDTSVRFYATKEFIQKAREVQWQDVSVEDPNSGKKSFPSSTQKYLM